MLNAINISLKGSKYDLALVCIKPVCMFECAVTWFLQCNISALLSLILFNYLCKEDGGNLRCLQWASLGIPCGDRHWKLLKLNVLWNCLGDYPQRGLEFGLVLPFQLFLVPCHERGQCTFTILTVKLLLWLLQNRYYCSILLLYAAKFSRRTILCFLQMRLQPQKHASQKCVCTLIRRWRDLV